jgi:3D (Asp-Asp-Asp) domain-containing protein
VTGSYAAETKLNGCGKRSSCGTEPKIGTIVADTAVFPYGTKIMVEGYGLCIVEDTGSAIKGNRLDLFMGYGEPALFKALRWGKKEVEVIVLK